MKQPGEFTTVDDLRIYLAAQAMHGILAGGAFTRVVPGDLTQVSCEVAEKMIAEMEKRGWLPEDEWR